MPLLNQTLKKSKTEKKNDCYGRVEENFFKNEVEHCLGVVLLLPVISTTQSYFHVLNLLSEKQKEQHLY